jgi:hypothetical protein
MVNSALPGLQPLAFSLSELRFQLSAFDLVISAFLTAAFALSDFCFLLS